jgi:hypothetical protein
VSVLEADIDNLRAAVAFGLATGDKELVREITAALPLYLLDRDLYAEGRSWLDRALALDGAEDDTRRRLLSGLATIAYRQGDHDVSASDEAAALAMRLAGVTERFQVLKDQARAAGMKNELDTAEKLWREAFEAAMDADNGVGISACRLNLVDLANTTRGHERAEALASENLPFVPGEGSNTLRGGHAVGAGGDAGVSRLRGGRCRGCCRWGETGDTDREQLAYCLLPRPRRRRRCCSRRAAPVGDPSWRHRSRTRGDGVPPG